MHGRVYRSAELHQPALIDGYYTGSNPLASEWQLAASALPERLLASSTIALTRFAAFRGFEYVTLGNSLQSDAPCVGVVLHGELSRNQGPSIAL